MHRCIPFMWHSGPHGNKNYADVPTELTPFEIYVTCTLQKRLILAEAILLCCLMQGNLLVFKVAVRQLNIIQEVQWETDYNRLCLEKVMGRKLGET